MRVLHLKEIEEVFPNDPVFEGEVGAQPLIDEGMTFKADMVNFRRGGRNKLHTHTTDQILVVTEGKGYIATEREKIEIVPGDVVFIPAGEAHWHGATSESEMSHIHVVGKGSPCVVVGD